MKRIYSLLSITKEWEIQVVELFDFVRLYNHCFERLARARTSGSKVHAKPNEQNIGSPGASGCVGGWYLNIVINNGRVVWTILINWGKFTSSFVVYFVGIGGSTMREKSTLYDVVWWFNWILFIVLSCGLYKHFISKIWFQLVFGAVLVLTQNGYAPLGAPYFWTTVTPLERIRKESRWVAQVSALIGLPTYEALPKPPETLWKSG